MILVRLSGGIGNQMFQYAAARRLAEHHDTRLRLDTSWFANVPEGHTARPYELDQLAITGVVSRHRVYGVRTAPLAIRPWAYYRTRRPRYRPARERHFHFDPDVLTLPKNVWLSGYRLSEKYFADIAPIIRTEFTVRAEPSPENRACIEQMASCESVAVHVRRGDFLRDTSRQGATDLDYYASASEVIRVRRPDPVFFVFSDDPEWVRENLCLDGETRFVTHNRDAPSSEDLRLMSSCRHNIIANSSYSWWGAWLNTHPDRIVIGPQKWMADPKCDTRDVLPAGWLAL